MGFVSGGRKSFIDAFAPCFLALILVCGVYAATVPANIAVKATKTTVTSFFQTADVKLVFVNNGSLYYINFSEAENPPVHSFTKTPANVSVPSISPDGQYVAYCSGPSGPNSTQAGSAYVMQFSDTATPVLVAASTGYNPRFIKNAPTTTVVYTTNTESDSWNGKGKVTSKRLVNGVPVSADSVIYTGGSYNAGLSWDGRYLGHANEDIGAYMMDLQNAAAGAHELHRLHFANNTTHADTLIALQTCNGSISSSRVFTNAMIYLDFGFANGKYTQPILGHWSSHDRVFIGDYNGNILKYIMSPGDIPVIEATVAAQSGKSGQIVGVTMEEPEWATHPYYAAAAILIDRLLITGSPSSPSYSHARYNEKIYGINIKDSTYFPLIASTDTAGAVSTINFSYPYIYVACPSGFTENQTWLATPIVPNVPSAVTRPFFNYSGPETYFLRLINKTIVASAPLRSLAFFSPDGRCIGRHLFANNPTTVAFDKFLPRAAGLKFAVVEFANGQRKTLPIAEY
ncbi:MAG: hypothetical protein PHC61_03300 [Chitinivibrionales bacterium]|nr:hypothetical protein [Chitinivibrionales bacterium]